jgi:hypothetical protein
MSSPQLDNQPNRASPLPARTSPRPKRGSGPIRRQREARINRQVGVPVGADLLRRRQAEGRRV